MPPVLIAAGIGAAGSVGGALIKRGGDSSIEERQQALEGVRFEPQARNELGVTNRAFKDALGQTQVSQAAPFLTQQGDFRGRQVGLADQLALSASGQGPSLVNPMAQTARENLLAQQLALQATAGGNANAGLLQRQTGINVAQGGQAIEREAMTQRMREIFDARQQLAGLVQAGRQADIQSADVASSDYARRAAIQGDLFGKALAREQEKARLELEKQRIAMGGAQQQAQSANQLAGGVISGTGSLLGSALESGLFG